MAKTGIHEKAHGILLAMADDQICGSWILYNNKSCFIVEMPPKKKTGATVPANLVRKCIKERGLIPAGLTITHAHWDHIDGMNDYRTVLAGYPPVSFICHKSALEMAPELESCFNTVFAGEIYETSIEGEPLYLIYAPKHSFSDVMIVFRGTMITGDWWLGQGDPNVNNILAETSIASIDRILDFLKHRNYIVRRLFSVHANDFRYDVNAESILLETRRYHEMQLIQGRKRSPGN